MQNQTYSPLPPIPAHLQPLTAENTGIEKLMNVREAAAYLRIGSRPIYKAIGSGRLAAAYVGRTWLIRPSSLAAFLTSAEQVGSSHKKAK